MKVDKLLAADIELRRQSNLVAFRYEKVIIS